MSQVKQSVNASVKKMPKFQTRLGEQVRELDLQAVVEMFNRTWHPNRQVTNKGSALWESKSKESKNREGGSLMAGMQRKSLHVLFSTQT